MIMGDLIAHDLFLYYRNHSLCSLSSRYQAKKIEEDFCKAGFLVFAILNIGGISLGVFLWKKICT